MEEKKKITLGSIIKNTIGSFVGLMGDLGGLIITEAQLAGRSVVSLILLYVLIGVFSLTTWFCLQALLVVFLVSLKFSWLISLLIVTLLNFLIVLSILLVINKTKQNLHFQATRRQLSRLKSLIKS